MAELMIGSPSRARHFAVLLVSQIWMLVEPEYGIFGIHRREVFVFLLASWCPELIQHAERRIRDFSDFHRRWRSGAAARGRLIQEEKADIGGRSTWP